jgi:hypothetical protein
MKTIPTKFRSCQAVIVYQPWQDSAYVQSTHASLRAASRMAAAAHRELRRFNPNAYGVKWIVGMSRIGETATDCAARIVAEEEIIEVEE